ncbi:MAG: hypothetical protein A2W31_05830 [Planctomycetes bacterium RBG_16_64_10]|nr:MAG: hypothetical protein A2W31_05830 [Planctomycetes bacterium RBG_16_64_10]
MKHTTPQRTQPWCSDLPRAGGGPGWPTAWLDGPAGLASGRGGAGRPAPSHPVAGPGSRQAARARLVATGIPWPVLLALGLLVGCGQSGYTVAPQAGVGPSALPPQQLMAGRQQELETRARALDQDNQELESLLAQSRQQIQLLKDELTAVRDQLHTSNQQLAETRQEKAGLEQRTGALVTSVQRRTGAQIKPNNSLVGQLALKHLPGVDVRQDGDVIRVELKADGLFDSGGAALTTDGKQLLGTVMADLLHNYPRQIVGIEGHTDSDPIRTQQFPSSRHLSLARATAVYEYLTDALRVPEAQLFVVGHAANHPVVSNATSAGKARNRRVELVVYPETFEGV